MIYEFKCKHCGEKFDVVKSAIEFSRTEPCDCGNVADLIITGGAGFMGAKVEHEEYCPALGCRVKNSQHRKEIAKERGLIEVGNENMDKYYDKMEAEREKRLEARWEED